MPKVTFTWVVINVWLRADWKELPPDAPRRKTFFPAAANDARDSRSDSATLPPLSATIIVE